jgi:ABC-type lipoprotein export system ATPase subunit
VIIVSDAKTLPFHPVISTWFEQSFGEPTDVQQQAWQAIFEGRHTLIAAPTGSGKTLAALLPCLDKLVRPASSSMDIASMAPNSSNTTNTSNTPNTPNTPNKGVRILEQNVIFALSYSGRNEKKRSALGLRFSFNLEIHTRLTR